MAIRLWLQGVQCYEYWMCFLSYTVNIEPHWLSYTVYSSACLFDINIWDTGPILSNSTFNIVRVTIRGIHRTQGSFLQNIELHMKVVWYFILLQIFGSCIVIVSFYWLWSLYRWTKLCCYIRWIKCHAIALQCLQRTKYIRDWSSIVASNHHLQCTKAHKSYSSLSCSSLCYKLKFSDISFL